MSITNAIRPELPYLRRYARAISGSQVAGDTAVRHTLEAILADPAAFDMGQPARVELYRVFHAHRVAGDENSQSGPMGQLASRARHCLLLSAVEEFQPDHIATILSIDVATILSEIETARTDLANQIRSKVLIIEDEAIIALHIEAIVRDLGHTVAGVARTHREAVDLARQTAPELVLADISLADGSSGIDAVKEILATMDVPVIFVTAFPERLLTGERPEPTYLITKPFEPLTLSATIAQALIMRASVSITPSA